MKTKEEFKPSFMPILTMACVFYAPFSFLINFICGLALTHTTLLQLWASFLIFSIAFVVALIVYFTRKTNYKKHLFNYFSCTYTAITFVLNVFVMFLEGSPLWSLYSLYLVLSFSVVFAILCTYMKIKNYLISTLIYYALSVTSFLILTAAIAGYSEGYQIMLSFSIFSVCYAIISIAYFLVKRSIAQIENEEKSYKPMFE